MAPAQPIGSTWVPPRAAKWGKHGDAQATLGAVQIDPGLADSCGHAGLSPFPRVSHTSTISSPPRMETT